jgi:hypothetical protein
MAHDRSKGQLLKGRRRSSEHRLGPICFASLMIDFIEQGIRNLLLFGQEAMSGGNVWILMLIVLIGIGVIAAVRGKLTESWLWIPVLALAMWYAVYRWLQIRA